MFVGTHFNFLLPSFPPFCSKEFCLSFLSMPDLFSLSRQGPFPLSPICIHDLSFFFYRDPAQVEWTGTRVEPLPIVDLPSVALHHGTSHLRWILTWGRFFLIFSFDSGDCLSKPMLVAETRQFSHGVSALHYFEKFKWCLKLNVGVTSNEGSLEILWNTIVQYFFLKDNWLKFVDYICKFNLKFINLPSILWVFLLLFKCSLRWQWTHSVVRVAFFAWIQFVDIHPHDSAPHEWKDILQLHRYIWKLVKLIVFGFWWDGK